MFPISKNLSHQQALDHLQSLFPSVALPTFTPNLNLKTILQSISNTLPIPQFTQHTNMLSSMKNIVDSQQYKIQRNMIEIQNYSQNLQLAEICSLDFYEQRSTAIDLNKKGSNKTLESSQMSQQSQQMWWNLELKHNSQQLLEKQCFSFLDC